MDEQEYMEKHQGIANSLLVLILMLQARYPGSYISDETYYGPSITEEKHQIGTVSFSIKEGPHEEV